MNTPVSFKIAKLIKEKGLDIEKPNFYNSHGQLKTTVQDFFIPRYEAPTIAEVVMWLYEKHGIWVSVTMSYSGLFWLRIAKQNKDEIDTEESFNSPTEAYSQAIEFTLKNLI